MSRGSTSFVQTVKTAPAKPAADSGLQKDRDHELLKTAPSILDYLNEESKAYFAKVQQYLTDIGIAFEVDPNLVRGLDYYNHTAFEIMSNAEGFGAITTLAGGGAMTALPRSSAVRKRRASALR